MADDRPFVPLPGARVPGRGNALTHAVAVGLLRLSGWRITGELPDLPRFVLIVAPHTSNWDFAIGVVAMFALGIRGTFLGKHTLFRWPFGIAMRWLGGVPVDRASPGNVVKQTIEYFQSSDRMVLALSPEGTRKKLPAWRTGFYYVATGAGVPIVPVAFDYPAHTIRIFAPVMPSGDIESDFARLRSHFREDMARHPDQY